MTKPKRLLIIDDDFRIRVFVMEVAVEQGFDVRQAANLEEFEEAYKAFDPTFIVLDMVMPEVDGIELLKRLARRGCNARILVISGYNPMYMDAARNLASGLEMPNVETLQKPFRVATLEAALAVGH